MFEQPARLFVFSSSSDHEIIFEDHRRLWKLGAGIAKNKLSLNHKQAM